MKTQLGEVEISLPRDRNGEYEPQIIEKYQRNADGLEEKIMPQVSEWQNRPLEGYYPFIFMDAIHYKIRDNHQIVSKGAYVVLGINEEEFKEILGMWIGGNESSKFWLEVLNELKSRGIKSVDLFCVDGLSGFREAIGGVYTFSDIQPCIIHKNCMKSCPCKALYLLLHRLPL